MKTRLWLLLGVAVLSLARAQEDPYLTYLKTAPEFQPVRQDAALLAGRWDTWIYMPWRYQWTIGTGDEGGQFCRDYGFNGGFTDHGRGPLAWLEQWQLRFYNDHTAGKGDLYLNRIDWKGAQKDARAVRFGAKGKAPLDDATLARLTKVVTDNVTALKGSPMRVAYALDDEISWGSFVKPLAWRLHENDADYAAWLKRYYGGKAPAPQYVTPEFTRAQLGKALKALDFAPFLDRMTYNDSYWANYLGALVAAANAADPATPCGFVGGQAPNLFGGYDYAKLCRKVQFVEAYNLGSSQAILRSFNPGNAMPLVTTHFHDNKRGTTNDIWQMWYYFAHGNRGMIGWVEKWFEEGKLRAWLDAIKPVNLELGKVQGPKLAGARWVHDGVAIYYSHPSIQVSWVLDAEAHGGTWVNRNGDHRLGTSHLVRKAWENLLTDAGLQYSFVSYHEVAVNGVPKEYKVLILPACYALSDLEARRFTEFCQGGGTLIADFACGLFDQHGTGRAAGACDALFGVKHDGSEAKADFFAGGKLWVETDQDKGFSYKTYAELFATLPCPQEEGYAVAEKRLPRHHVNAVGAGRAVYVDLSPQRYLQYREERRTTDALREPFLKHVRAAGVKPWVTVADQDGRRPVDCEVTYWRKGERLYVFVLQNAAVSGGEAGGGGVEGLASGKQTVTVTFATPLRDVVDERAAKPLGDGAAFSVEYDPVQAVLLSAKAP